MKLFKRSQTGPRYSCSFCGKSQDDVRKLIAGPKVYICDRCVELCSDIIALEHAEESAKDAERKPAEDDEERSASMGYLPTCLLCRMPGDPEALLLIPDRGPLCNVCIGLIRAASQRPLAMDSS